MASERLKPMKAGVNMRPALEASGLRTSQSARKGREVADAGTFMAYSDALYRNQSSGTLVRPHSDCLTSPKGRFLIWRFSVALWRA